MRYLPLYPHAPVVAVEAEEPRVVDPSCTRCPMHEGVRTPCLSADGEPGGLLVVSEIPGRNEDALGRPFVGESGKLLRPLVAKHWRGPVAFDNALRCAPGKREVKDRHVDHCRGYLAQTVAEAAPERILSLGSWAAYGLLGRGVGMLSARRGYTYLLSGRFGAAPIPVFFVLNPAAGLRNRFLKRWFEEDLQWALTVDPPPLPPLDEVVRVVTTRADAEVAVAALSAAAWASVDVETAGVMFDRSFRLLCVSACAEGDESPWAWDAAALSKPGVREPLERWLADADAKKVGANVKFDELALESELSARRGRKAPLVIRGVVGDVRLWRKLLEPEAEGKLDRMVELVGMGGMKEEAQSEMAPIVARIKRGLEWERRLQKRAEEDRARAARGEGPKKWPKVNPVGQAGLDALAAVDRDLPDLAPVVRDPEAPWEAWAYALIPEDMLLRYNGRDTAGTTRLTSYCAERLAAEPELDRTRRLVVDRAAHAVRKVEGWGVPVDRPALDAFASYLDGHLAQALAKIRAHAGPEFEPGNPHHVRAFLFDRLKLKPVKETATGLASTDAEVLEALRGKHPAVGDILRFREWNTMQTRYGAGMKPYVRRDGRIHTSILLDGARCLPRGELVLTARGYLPVEQVVPGDDVLTHEGRARSVTDVIENPPATIYRVTLSSGHVLRTTGAHEYMTVGRGWVTARELRLGDVVWTLGAPEVWRPVAGWPYFVSSWGRVRSARGGAPLALARKYGADQGHLKVGLVRGDRLRRNGNRKDFPVHRLVAAAFCGVPSPGQTAVRHLNGIAWDNHAENLRWGTPAENAEDARRHGTLLGKAGCVLSAADVEWIRAQPKAGSKQARGPLTDAGIAARLGVSREAVRDIRSGRRRADLRVGAEPRATFDLSLVMSVEVGFPEENVGLVVAEDHSHVTAGIVTHNSGRTSSQDPNLQNIPRAADSPEGKMARDVFVSLPGWLLVELDYSQLELRIAAMLSKDPEMIRIFLSGVDYHRRTAELVAKLAWGIDPSQVQDPHRTQAKTINFSTLYGAGIGSIAAKLGITYAQAERVVTAIMGHFKVLAGFIKDCIAETRRTGYAWTWWAGQRARRRPLYRIADQDEGARNTAENGAFNTPVQGTASEYLVASLADTVEWLEEDGLEGDAQVVLPVHDSLLLHVREDMALEAARRVRRIMLGHDSQGVPLEVDCKMGRAWGSLVKVPLNDAQKAEDAVRILRGMEPLSDTVRALRMGQPAA